MTHFPTFARWGRALKHSQRGFRIAMLVLAAAVLLALGGLLALKASASHRVAAAWPVLEQRLGPLDPATYNLPPVPADQNAFTWLDRGAEALPVLSADDHAALDLMAGSDASEWASAGRATLERVIESNRRGVEILHRAAGLERSSQRVDYSRGFATEVPNYIPLLRAAKALAADARWALTEGDGERATRSATALSTLVRSLDREPTLLAKILGSLAEKKLLLVAQTAIDTGADREVLDRLRSLLGDVEPAAGFRAALAYDAAAMHHTYLGEAKRERGPDPLGLEALSIERLYAAIADGYVELAEAPAAPFTALAAAIELPEVAHPGIGKLAVPDLLGLAAQLASTAAGRQLAATALHLRAASLATGRYPETLPADLARPDPMAGTRPSYRILPDGSAELSLPEAQAAVDRWLGRPSPGVVQAPLAWHLPPPPPPAAAG